MYKSVIVKVFTGLALTSGSLSLTFVDKNKKKLEKEENAEVPICSTNKSHRNVWFYTQGLVRFGRTALTTALIVFDYKYSLRGLDNSTDEYKKKQSEVHTRSALKLKKLCYKNSGCYIKVGQHLGVLDYLIPNEYVQVMKALHKEAPSSTIEDMLNVIKEEFGKDVSEVFSYFDPQPLASASVAQVHRARLLSGEEVVVKIQHPLVMKVFHVDMFTMDILFKLVSKIFPTFDFQWLADETRKNLPLELDFKHEAENNEKARKMFREFKFIRIPHIYMELTSPRIITMEYCEGGFINDLKYYRDNEIDTREVMSELGKLYSEMIFKKGYIHCDPHPGNILVANENNRPIIKLLDHGLYQELPDDIRLAYCSMWTGIFNKDEKVMREAAERLGIKDKYPLLACILTSRSWHTINKGLDKAYTKSEDQAIRTSASLYLSDISLILNQLPRPLLLILKTNDLIRGVERSLDCRSDASAFLVMFRSCVVALSQDEIEKCASFPCRVYKMINLYWVLLKLSTFSCYLRISHFFTSKLKTKKLDSQDIDGANLLTP